MWGNLGRGESLIIIGPVIRKPLLIRKNKLKLCQKLIQKSLRYGYWICGSAHTITGLTGTFNARCRSTQRAKRHWIIGLGLHGCNSVKPRVHTMTPSKTFQRARAFLKSGLRDTWKLLAPQNTTFILWCRFVGVKWFVFQIAVNRRKTFLKTAAAVREYYSKCRVHSLLAPAP